MPTEPVSISLAEFMVAVEGRSLKFPEDHMSKNHYISMPPLSAVTAFLGVEPAVHAPEDGYWAYELAGAGGEMLRFSFNILDGSVQLILTSRGREIGRISQEGATNMSLQGEGDGQRLKCEFHWDGAQGVLEVAPAPNVSFHWYTLETN
jgi:hypothetical protein